MEKGITYALVLFVIAYTLKIIDIFVLGGHPYNMYFSKIISLILVLYIVSRLEEKKYAYIGLTATPFGYLIFVGIILFVILSACSFLPGLFLNTITFYGYEFDLSLGLHIPTLFFFVIDSTSDEAVYRGYIQKKFSSYGFWKAIGFQGLLYGISHFMWAFYIFWDTDTGTLTSIDFSVFIPYSLNLVTFAFYVGVLTGYAVARTKSIIPSIMGHALLNTLHLVVIMNRDLLLTWVEILLYPVLFLVGLLVLIGLLGGEETPSLNSP